MGAATVKGYSAGQNAKDTGTSQYVSTHINKPFVQSRDSANGWGSGLIGHFVSGMTAKGSEVKQAAKDMAKKSRTHSGKSLIFTLLPVS